MVYTQRLQHSLARDACSAAATRLPEEGALYLQRAMSKAALEDIDGAFADIDTAILLLPDPAPAFAQKGYFMAAVGQLDAALTEYSAQLSRIRLLFRPTSVVRARCHSAKRLGQFLKI